MNPIMPTIGRNVYFYPSAGAREQHANIVDVHSESLVNLFTVNHGGTASSVTSVPYAADGETPTGPHWRWMPYQRGQALAAQVPQAGRPADVQLVKLEENGELTDAGREKLGQPPGDGLGDDMPVGDVLDGTDRTTSGAIGQP